ncbi:Uu.00g067610.m01.CDS01 [Anthostomella pinea]|uniref:Uu.00g067610.m01.CDS01 n=1 Tax=Anthostomella pinea TaxID=933095 RepID=A0AAI8YNI2_9PEZI|nr:Uu.00g067610.m01.CDS01 [Anthostomella pinea]
MVSLFQSLEAEDLLEEEKPIFDVLKASLHYPSTPNVLAQRLADDIVFFCRSAREDEDYEAILTLVWDMAFDMISCIPSDHEWQDVWVNALEFLRVREDLPPRDENMPDGVSWHELPLLLRQQRARLDKACFDDQTKWRNLNSFSARLYASGVTETSWYPVVELRGTVEKYASSASVPEAALWVATEWVIRCPDRIFRFLQQADEPEGEMPERVWGLGDAWAGKEDVGLLSVERWNLWKKWFSEKKEKLSEADSGTVDSATLGRVSEALEKMCEAEERAKCEPTTDGSKHEVDEQDVPAI